MSKRSISTPARPTAAQQAAAQKAAEAEERYLDQLESQWKVPLSQEQYAIIRAGLLPIMQARVEREAA